MSTLEHSKKNSVSIGVDIKNKSEMIATTLKSFLEKEYDTNRYSDIVFVCIGSERLSGDAFAPLVGYYLNNANLGLKVHGMLNDPINALNYEEIREEIYELYSNPFIIALDACASKGDTLYNITLSTEKIAPAASKGKPMTEIGEISILLNSVDKDDLSFLRYATLPLGQLLAYSEPVVEGIKEIASYIKELQVNKKIISFRAI